MRILQKNSCKTQIITIRAKNHCNKLNRMITSVQQEKKTYGIASARLYCVQWCCDDERGCGLGGLWKNRNWTALLLNFNLRRSLIVHYTHLLISTVYATAFRT